MDDHATDVERECRIRSGGHGRSRLVFWGFAAIAGVLLFTEHRAHALGVLPYLLLLACPLMHLFHHGHGGHHHHGPRDAGKARRDGEQRP